MMDSKESPKKAIDKASIAIVVSVLSLIVAIVAALNSCQQTRIAEQSYRAVSGHARVFRTTLDDQLRLPLRHGTKLAVRFINMSTVTQSYDVQVRGEGLFVSQTGATTGRDKRRIRLGAARIAVAKDDQFSESFQVWFSEDPPNVATLEVLIDDEVVDSVTLKYDRKAKSYFLRS